MTRIYLLVEGQTEEAFVNELLRPHYARQELYLIPIIAATSRTQKGGITSYAKIRPQIEKLGRQDRSAHITTLFDLYALPTDFPGKNDPAYPEHGSGHDKAAFIENAWAQDIGWHNFIPNLLVHEFEALLFADTRHFSAWTDDATVQWLHDIRQKTAPEDINETPHTAPSKRIRALWRGYEKTFHGPLIACDIGLDNIRTACPHFHAWLSKMEQLIA